MAKKAALSFLLDDDNDGLFGAKNASDLFGDEDVSSGGTPGNLFGAPEAKHEPKAKTKRNSKKGSAKDTPRGPNSNGKQLKKVETDTPCVKKRSKKKTGSRKGKKRSTKASKAGTSKKKQDELFDDDLFGDATTAKAHSPAPSSSSAAFVSEETILTDAGDHSNEGNASADSLSDFFDDDDVVELPEAVPARGSRADHEVDQADTADSGEVSFASSSSSSVEPSSSPPDAPDTRASPSTDNDPAAGTNSRTTDGSNAEHAHDVAGTKASPRTSTTSGYSRSSQPSVKADGISDVRMYPAEMRTVGRSQFRVYPLSCRTPKKGKVFRRYRQFAWLRGWLVAYAPGVFVPPIPPKQGVGHKVDTFAYKFMFAGAVANQFAANDVIKDEARFFEDRQRDLQYFLTRLCKQPMLASSPALELFVSVEDDTEFEEGCRALDEAVTGRQVTQVIRDYREWFPGLSVTRRLSDSDQQRLTQAGARLAAVEQQGVRMVSHTRGVASSSKDAMESLEVLTAQLAEMQTMERHRPSGLEERFDACDPFTQWHAFCQEQPRFLKLCLAESFRHELQDCRALLELMALQLALVNTEEGTKGTGAKAAANKFLGSLSGSPAEGFASSIYASRDANQRHALGTVIGSVLLHHSLPEGRRYRVERYNDNMKQLAMAHLQAAQRIDKVWGKLAEDTGPSF